MIACTIFDANIIDICSASQIFKLEDNNMLKSGQYSAGKIDEKELLEVESRACPGAGSCGAMFTANTMSSAFEALGMSLPYSSTMAAEDTEKADSTEKCVAFISDRPRR